MLAQILVNAYRDPKRGQPPKLSDFMYADAESAQEQQERDTLQFFRSLKAASSG
jgi:hypothetical protein